MDLVEPGVLERGSVLWVVILEVAVHRSVASKFVNLNLNFYKFKFKHRYGTVRYRINLNCFHTPDIAYYKYRYSNVSKWQNMVY